ncbi:uncharacterized protein [Watersipora subatra]|uniref:uncharacterized protein n=1 Tax=Watersipora subatra TaxID=2589382 RepID=UPI00355C7051
MNISQLPDRFDKLQKLKALRITGNLLISGPLQSVPEVVTNLPSLEKLDLSYNKINQLPDRYLACDVTKQAPAGIFDKLQQLKVLKITGSLLKPGPLQSVPEVVTKLTSLEELDLSRNQINQLPDAFDKLQRLKVLTISGPYRHGLFQSVPEVVTKLTSLEELDLSDNQINQLPDRIDDSGPLSSGRQFEINITG